MDDNHDNDGADHANGMPSLLAALDPVWNDHVKWVAPHGFRQIE